MRKQLERKLNSLGYWLKKEYYMPNSEPKRWSVGYLGNVNRKYAFDTLAELENFVDYRLDN